MKIDDLDLRELLVFDPKGGIIRFAGKRALIMDTVALGLLRRELIDRLGQATARGLLTRFGYAHGWRTAETLHTAIPWDSEREWKTAGARLHKLTGAVIPSPTPPAPDAVPGPFAEALWHDSYEAEQHVLHFGRADAPVCWTLSGFVSGYLSRCNGTDYYATEVRCVGKGDPHCHLVARSREEWGAAVEELLPYYTGDCMEVALKALTEELKQAERRLHKRQEDLERVAGPEEGPSGLIARSEPMLKVVDMAQRVSVVDATVLISGESGVGKERVARLIHDDSARARGPFVAVNCGAVTETLLESELFGHAKGAFTGATADRPGLFEAASGGTLLLDEIGEVTPSMQVKLLRTLQEREVRRVGENKSRPVDVRVLAATNRNLADEVKAGRFRQDLYYRLRVIELHVPPLRERRDDVLALSRVMLARATARLGRAVTGLSPEAADQLLRYAWPGNVRELENAIERAVVLARGTRIEVDDLPEEVRNALPSTFATGEQRALADVEREYILAVLKANSGNQARTAAQLQIGTATLYRKLKQYGANGR